MNFDSISVKFSTVKQDEQLGDLYTTLLAIPKNERVKVLMSWLANAYSDLLIPFLTEEDVLSTFTVNVRLLDRFANNSPYEVVAQLASEFSDKFLKSQVVPNFLENSERTADVTFYIQTFVEHITCPSLIRKIMDVVTSDLTPILIGRMLSDNQSVSQKVAAATLSLLKVLLEFYCEDLWYELVLQYLLPMKHLLTSQRQKMLPEIEFHESTNKLLQLIPQHVSDAIKSSLLAQHFLLYFQDEVMRRRDIDSAIASSLPSSRSQLQKVGLGIPKDFEITAVLDEIQNAPRKTGCNVTYPMWVFQYDGTDFLHALRRGYLQEPEEFFEDDLFSEAHQLNLTASSASNLDNSGIFERDSGLPLSRSEISNDEDNYALASISVPDNYTEARSVLSDDDNQVSISPPPDEDYPSLSNSIVKDKRKSFDNLEETDRYYNSYFGPLLKALYVILQRWAELEPDVLFTATEIISVLASSRIPLLNSLFLDMSLTLQPSFPSFPALLHTIRNELDEKMKKYPDYIFRSVWRSTAKDCSIPELVLNETQNDDDDTEDHDGLGIVDSLRRAIGANRSIRLATEELRKSVVGRRTASFRAFKGIFKSPTKSSSEETTSEFRLLNRAAAPFETEEEENCAKTMALRSVLFTHWMLELGAIATQLCWGRKAIRGSENVDHLSSRTGNSNGENEESKTEGNAEATMY